MKEHFHAAIRGIQGQAEQLKTPARRSVPVARPREGKARGRGAGDQVLPARFLGQPGGEPEDRLAHGCAQGQDRSLQPAAQPVRRPAHYLRDGDRGKRRIHARGAGERLQGAGRGRGGAEAVHPADRRVRQEQRAGVLPRGRGRHRGAGLVRNAVPHVHPLGRAPRLHLQDHGLPGRRRSRPQVGGHHHRGRKRLRLPQGRVGRAPSGAHFAV